MHTQYTSNCGSMSQSMVEDFTGYLTEYELRCNKISSEKWGDLFALDSHDTFPYKLQLSSAKSRNTKIVTTLSYITMEMKTLNKDFMKKMLPKLPFLHLDSTFNLLKHLQNCSEFISYSREIIHNALNQLYRMYSTMNLSPHIHFQTLYCELGSLLGAAAIMDQIFNFSKLNLRLKEIIMALRTEKENSETKVLIKVLLQWENMFCTEDIFNKLVEQDFGDFRAAKSFGSSFLSHIKNALELCHDENSLKFLEASCLIRLLKNIFPSNLEKRLLNKYWDIALKFFPVVHLADQVIWLPEKFMSAICDSKRANSIQASRNQLLNSAMEEFKVFSKDVFNWSLGMHALNDEMFNKYGEQDEESLKSVLMTGIHLANKMRFKASVVLNLHKNYNLPLAKSMAIKLLQSLELVKLIHRTYKNKASFLHKFLLIHGTKLMLSGHLEVGKIRKAYGILNSDLIGLLSIAEDALNGPLDSSRLITARLSITVAGALPERIIKDIEILCFGAIFRDLDFVSQFPDLVKSATDTSFFNAHRELLGPYLGFLLQELNLEKIVYVLDILEDCFLSLPPKLQSLFEKDVKDDIHLNFLEPLSRELETDIRLQVHSHLGLDERNPFKSSGAYKDFLSAFDNSEWSFFDRSYVVNMQTYLESYLEKIFYTQTAVAPHDWKTYSEMKGLISHIYTFDIGDDHLPSKILDQGLDVLEIIKCMDNFVSEYNYNLNNQSFIQMKSKNKHLNCIGISQIANSIRTHGMGIINTTVNSTYKLLRSKMKSYSLLLFEDHIKSRLKKDSKYYEEFRHSVNHMFPYERAEKFISGIQKSLKTSKNSSVSKLDTFRSLVTQIGNAMGLVRTIRSGGLHYISNAICFIPDLKDIPSFSSMCDEEQYPMMSTEAAVKLDGILENMTRKLGEKNEYFQLLISIFSKHVLDEKQNHLKNFYLVVPALTINYVEHSILLKENIMRKNMDEGSYTDDGFSMGIAYLLTLMKQWTLFESLNWFKSVNRHFINEEMKVQKDKTTSDRKLTQTIALTSQRLDAYKKEFELLYFNLSSAKIFFQEDGEEGSCGQKNKDCDAAN